MKADLCLDTHSAGEINLVHKYIASLNEVKQNAALFFSTSAFNR